MANVNSSNSATDPTESTKDFYNAHVDEYIANINKAGVTHVPSQHYDTFVGLLPKGGDVLEVGCGYGRDAARFAQLGFHVVATDYSRGMLLKAQQEQSANKKILLMEMDMRYLGKHLLPNSFDGIWACATIIHVPKRDIPALFVSFWDLLRPGGIMYISVKQGTGETFDPDERYGGIKKFYAFYTQQELLDLLIEAGFQTVESGVGDHREKDTYATHAFLHVFCRKEADAKAR